MAVASARESDRLQVLFEPRPAGSRATYIVKTNSPQELDALRQFFMRLSDLMEVRPLADGHVSAYAVQHFEPCRTAHSDIEGVLARYFEYVVCEPSAGETVLDLVHSLCEETGSRELEIDRCGICGVLQPFPTTVVTVSEGDGGWSLRRVYCTPCIANITGQSNRELVSALLAADAERFPWARGAELTQDDGGRALRGGRVAFRLERAA